MNLTRADAFLGRAHQINHLEPHSKGSVAVLENGADLDRELFTALIALPQADPRGFAIQAPDLGAVAVAAVRANRAGRPQPRFNVSAGGLFVAVVWGVEFGGHGSFSGMGEVYPLCLGVSTITASAHWRLYT